MRRTYLTCFVPLFFLAAALRGQSTCDCSKLTKTPKVLSGGDGHPLKWYSSSTLMHQPPGALPVYCYERAVLNYGPEEVRDVVWPVAAYSKRSQPPAPKSGDPNCCCDPISIVGSIVATPPKGPLFYGPSGMYSTSVWAPDSGWSTAKAQVYGLKGTPPGVLASGVQFAVELPDGGFAVSNVRLVSRAQVTSESAGTDYVYELENDSKQVTLVRFALPEAGNFWRQAEFNPGNVISLQPGQKILRHAASKFRAALAYTPVSIANQKQEVLARGLMSMYFPREEPRKE